MYSDIFMAKRYIMYLNKANKNTKCVVVLSDTKSIINIMKWYEFAKQLMDEQKIKQDDLKDVLGVATRGAVGHYLSGRRSVSAEQFNALANKLNVSMDILFCGKNTNSLFNAYEQLSPENKILVENTIKALSSNQQNHLTPAAPHVGGGGCGVIDECVDRRALERRVEIEVQKKSALTWPELRNSFYVRHHQQDEGDQNILQSE